MLTIISYHLQFLYNIVSIQEIGYILWLTLLQMMSNSLKGLAFDGTGDVKAFLTKVKLVAKVKGYDNEKLAAAIGSKLDGCALDLYMRLSDDDKKSPIRIKEELLKEYERGIVIVKTLFLN